MNYYSSRPWPESVYWYSGGLWHIFPIWSINIFLFECLCKCAWCPEILFSINSYFTSMSSGCALHSYPVFLTSSTFISRVSRIHHILIGCFQDSLHSHPVFPGSTTYACRVPRIHYICILYFQDLLHSHPVFPGSTTTTSSVLGIHHIYTQYF